MARPFRDVSLSKDIACGQEETETSVEESDVDETLVDTKYVASGIEWVRGKNSGYLG